MLNHPNIVQVIDKGQDGELLYFAMEYVEGTSLDAVLRKHGVSLPRTLFVIKEVCRGLEYAHCQGVVHRDLNPRNILVSDDLETIKLADFGISRVDMVSSQQGTLTTGQALGTLHYISPEQSADAANVDHRTDLYSLGVVFYEMLTGRVPVGKFKLPSQLNNEIPPDIDPVVLKCLAFDPAERYSSAVELQEAVTGLEEKLRFRLVEELRGISRGTRQLFSRSTRRLFSKRWLQAAAVAMLLLAVVGLAFFLGGRGRIAQSSRSDAAVADLGIETSAPAAVEGLDPEGGSLPASPLPQRLAPPLPTQPRAASKTSPPSLAAEVVTKEPPPVEVANRRRSPADAAARQALDVAKQELEAGLLGPAESDLREFIGNQEGSLVAEALMLMAELQRAQRQDEDAMASYVEVEARFPDHSSTPEAKFQRALMVEQSRRRDKEQEARRVLVEVSERYPESVWAPQAMVEQARIEEDKKMRRQDEVLGALVPAALVTWRDLVERYPDHEHMEATLWSLAEEY